MQVQVPYREGGRRDETVINDFVEMKVNSFHDTLSKNKRNGIIHFSCHCSVEVVACHLLEPRYSPAVDSS